MKKYYYTDGANSFGPFTLEELQEKKIGRETKIWFEGSADWQPAGNLPELFDLFKSVPPPIPKIERNNSVTENLKNQNSTNNSISSPQTVVVVGKSKSVGIAFLLSFLFGPLGLFYSSVAGGIIMLILGVAVGIITLGFGLIFIWIACIIWAVIAANSANKKLLNNSGMIHSPIISNPNTEQPSIIPKENGQIQNKQQDIQNQSIQEISEPNPINPINASSSWISKNKKGLLIGTLCILGAVILFFVIKFLLPVNGNKQEKQKTSSNIVANDHLYHEESSLVANKLIEDTYLGTIGSKDFKLFIEKVDGEYVEGYNVTGKNRRPVKGKIVNKWEKPTGLGGNYTVFRLILTEPGDDEWDGEFIIDLYISDIGRSGEGSWKAFNGKLERKIVLKDRL